MKSFALALVLATSLYAQHQVQLTFSNTSCLNDASCGLSNCLCSTQVWRAACSTATTCPSITTGLGTFTALATNSSNMTATTSSTGTSWIFNDTDTALTDNSIWVYAIANSYAVQNPPSPQSTILGSAAVTIPASTVNHLATLNYTSSDCNTTNNCWIQLWRATCNSPTACPSFIMGNIGWMMMSHASFPVWNTTSSGTTWQIQDTGLDGGIVSNATYVYVATVCWAGTCAAYSPASAPWIGTTAGPKKVHPGRITK